MSRFLLAYTSFKRDNYERREQVCCLDYQQVRVVLF